MTKAAIDKSSANDHSTLSKPKTIGGAGTNGDSGRKYTNTRQKWRDATRTGYCRLRRNNHLYDTEVSEATWDITSGGRHHHPRHERRSDATFKEHREKTRITVQYLDDPAPVDKSDVLVMPMRGYDLVRGLPWFNKQNLDIDWARLTSLRSPSASGVEEMTPMTTAVASKVSEAENDNVKTSFWGAVLVYWHLEQPHSTIF